MGGDDIGEGEAGYGEVIQQVTGKKRFRKMADIKPSESNID